jgi:hypothetical protein
VQNLSLPARMHHEAIMKRAKKALRLTYELDAIEGAVTAAWLLCEGLRTQQFGEAGHFEQVPKAVSGALALVSVRLQLVGAVLRGSRPPEELWAPHNQAGEDEEEARSNDLILVEDRPAKEE